MQSSLAFVGQINFIMIWNGGISTVELEEDKASAQEIQFFSGYYFECVDVPSGFSWGVPIPTTQSEQFLLQ